MMSRLGDIGGRLYRGEVSFDFVGRKRMFYLISGIIVLISLVALLVRGLNYSVEFKGGSVFQFTKAGVSVSEVRAATKAGGAPDDPIVQALNKGKWHVQTQSLTNAQVTKVQDSIASRFGLNPDKDVSVNSVGPSWGKDISQKALQGLIAFLIAIVLYLSFAFEWRMAVSAIITLIHDIVIAVGIYALVGFEVAPATVIGLLTILGYSLYDTVVVFDKVRENTAGLLGGARMTYSQAANLAVNQTLIRSINTSIVGLLPVAAILFVGAGVLGAGTLKDLALVLFVGMFVGTYSSICIATPILVTLKEREPQYQALARRVAVRESGARAERRQAKKAKTKAAVGASGAEVGEDGADGGADQAGGAGGQDAEGAPPAAAAAASAPRARQGQPARQGGQGQQRRGGQRQQPRRSSAAKRRPSGKKKR
jgi:preprotein translocase subunit SecF